MIDGGSSDQTSSACDDCATLPLVRVIRHECSSASSKRNRAVEESQADYLIFTDPDCSVDAQWLPALAEAADRGIQCATGRVISPSPGLEASVRKRSEDREFRPGLLNRAFAFRAGSSNNLMIERELLISLGGFPEDLGPGTANGVAEDTEVLYRALRMGITIHFIAAAEVTHQHPESTEQFLIKKRNYARGLNYFMTRRYLADPATWISIATTFKYSLLCLVGFLVMGNFVRVRQAKEELKGRLSGIVLGLSKKR